jgi:phosphatidylethanolamine-binding protein (PEBP) family uncharacterized protein
MNNVGGFLYKIIPSLFIMRSPLFISFSFLSTSMRILADWENNGYIPKMHTCEGMGSFPELTFKEIPLQAKSLAIIVDDPDAPG